MTNSYFVFGPQNYEIVGKKSEFVVGNGMLELCT